MRRSWPLSTNPEFSVLECPGYSEYRVENWRLARDGSSRTISCISTLSWLDAILAAALSVAWLKVASVRFSLHLFSQSIQATHIWLVPIVIAILSYVWWRCNQVLSGKVDISRSVAVIQNRLFRIYHRASIPRGSARDSPRFSFLLSASVYWSTFHTPVYAARYHH